MLATTTSDVASLWKLALVLLILVFIVLFRKPLRTLLETGSFHVKHGKTEVGVTQAASTRAAPAAPAESEADAPPVEEGDAEGEIQVADAAAVEQPGMDDGEPTLFHVYTALRSGDRQLADTTFERLQEAAESDKQRMENRVNYASLRTLFADDGSAMAELVTLSSDERVAFLAKATLARVYERTGFPDRALELFKELLGTGSTDPEIAGAAIGVAGCLRRLERAAEAYSVLDEAIGRVNESDARRRIFVEIADQYELDGDWFNRAIALDSAVELAPNDARLRFGLAYAFAEADYDDLALMHYKATLALDDGHVAARNNLGVAYDAIGAPIAAVKAFKRSSDGGNTLASANLASKLINVGFVDEAREILVEASARDEPHQNVAKNIARLQESAEAESEKEKLADDRAQAMDVFFRRYGAACADPTEAPSVGGAWLLDVLTPVTIQQDGRKLEIDWKEGDTPQRLSGRLAGRTALLSRNAWEYSLSKREYAFVVKDPAYAYFVSDDEFRVSICSSPESRVVKTFRRVTP